MERNEKIKVYDACTEKEEGYCDSEGSERRKRKFTKPYVLYCVMTLSVMLFALAFAASELFSLFFSEGYPGQMFLSRFFGFYVTDEKSFKEILLETSFADLSFISDKNGDGNENTLPVVPDSTTDKNTEPTDKTSSDMADETTSPDFPDVTDNIYLYDSSEIPEGMCGIIPMDLSLTEYGHDYINDSSVLSANPETLKKYEFSVDTDAVFPNNAPIVLIVHTHGSEAFTDEGVNYYDSTKEVSRSYDTEKNVVALGRVMAEILNNNGVPTIHCEIMHDANSYSGAYEASGNTVEEYLKKYPSIQYVIDVHRDAVVKSTGELVKALCLTEKGKSAQIMCVVGTGENGVSCKNWERNLALAQKLRETLNAKTENLCRPTCLRDSSYNQQYAPYSILIEIGAAGNTLDEAEIAARYAAEALVAVIKE